MSNHRFISYESREALSKALAAELLGLLNRELDNNKRAGLVVSGGTTPVPLFKTLSRGTCDWSGVDITLADERWVDQTSPESNEGLVRHHFLQNKAAAARFTGLKTDHPTPHGGEHACSLRLQALPQPFTAVILGMGTDGHTASLFPGAIELQEAISPSTDKLCRQITPPTGSHLRMTLTLPVLLNTRSLLLHITGEEKRAVYKQALAGDDLLSMPVRAILHQNTVEVSVYWAP